MENKKEETNKTGESGSSMVSARDENITRVVISKDAEKIASEVLERVNDGFEAGRATKLDVINFIFNWFKSNITDDVIYQLRMSCTDEMTMLENVLKRAKSSGNLPPEIKNALAQHFFGGGNGVSKKGKKNLKTDSIIDTIDINEAA
ncbi:MAG: hypothetical protein JNM24_00095 [Bdellovibrionaceae bacterium]|nr:hypothetical protein [Pseudobdellovibrionaceae bacterium]